MSKIKTINLEPKDRKEEKKYLLDLIEIVENLPEKFESQNTIGFLDVLKDALDSYERHV